MKQSVQGTKGSTGIRSVFVVKQNTNLEWQVAVENDSVHETIEGVAELSESRKTNPKGVPYL